VEWALPEWTVLAVVREAPTHGFAIAALTAPAGDLGRIWQMPRPVIYRALDRLAGAEHIARTGVESDRGPQRTIYAATDAGRAAVDGWLRQPVYRMRELRSQLLMKLALLDRRGVDPGPLLRDQRAVVAGVVERLGTEREHGTGFDAVLLAWRHNNASAALRFLDEIG
jgi:DNA-binding PadR family transcriptional regulator